MIVLPSILVTLSVSMASAGELGESTRTGLHCPNPTADAPRVSAYQYARSRLFECVQQAGDGDLSQTELRRSRKAIESVLDATLLACEAVFARGDAVKIDEARSQFNQARISSMEWEYFGSEPAPEWGWDPAAARECAHGYTADPTQRQ